MIMLLAEANKLLVEKGIFSITEQYDKTLKIGIEQNLIKHAFQTDSSPKQWRIPLSEEGLKRKKSVAKRSVPKKSVPKKIVKPKVQSFKPKNEIPTFTSNQKIWLAAIVICVLAWLAEPFSENHSNEKIKNSSYDSSVYQVKNYLNTNYSNYEPIKWFNVVKINENEYRVMHKFKVRNDFGEDVVEQKIFSLDSVGNINSTMDVE